MRRLIIAFVAAVALAGCGSNGSTSAPPGQPGADQHRQPHSGTVAAGLDGAVDEDSLLTQGRSGPVHRQDHQQVLPARSGHCDGLRRQAGRGAAADRADGDQRDQGHFRGAHDRRAGHRHGSPRGAHVGLVRAGRRGQRLVLRRGHQGVHERRRVEHRRFLGGGRRRSAAGHHHAGQPRAGRRVPTGVPADGRGGRGPHQADSAPRPRSRRVATPTCW